MLGWCRVKLVECIGIGWSGGEVVDESGGVRRDGIVCFIIKSSLQFLSPIRSFTVFFILDLQICLLKNCHV